MYEKNMRSWLKHLDFILIDLVALSLAFLMSYFMRQNMGEGLRQDISYRSFYLVMICIHILIAFFFRGYSNIVRRDYLEEIIAIIKQNLIMLGCILIYLVFTKQSQFYSRLFLGFIFVANILIMIFFRISWKAVVRHRLKKSEKLDKLLVVSNSNQVITCIKKLTTLKYQSYHIAGVILLDDDNDVKDVENIPVVANRRNMMEYVRLNVVDQVVIQMDSVNEKVENLAKDFLNMGIVVHISIGQGLDTLPHKQIQNLGNLSVITSSIQSANMMELFIKRIIDIVGGLFGLLITMILTIFIGPLIYMKSPGPIFFTQYRMGKNGRKFKLYKFRSMYMGAEEQKKDLMKKNQMQGFMFKMDNDPRIIKGIGHFIRNTSIDEFPQFWNVLKGDISLVGTRPPTVDEFEQYELHHKVRLSFKPGLTGLWQVSGRNDITDFEDVVRLDEQYIANWSIWLDLKIILKTVEVVIRRKGSK